ncbi:hypothetical protein [Mucilaginibacter aquaedulcis]|uniref:hypothetical protein n=1 Tax=Mucilaginibacter aquaedulcis TaxID=1187081 RepID=UPI0025B3E6E8|nr:hypothetical protein [Mucilaginibacter aquaedulcis]MDN3550501.1 hypothetical protein [Mucilaginibacter aquaedulcis]
MNLDIYKDVSWNGSSFWHGTSTIFLDSIRKTGLGTISPAKDYKLLAMLTFLYQHIQQQNIWHPILDINRTSIEAAIAQSDMLYEGRLLNYRHDGVYVSASALRAAYYACLNKVGSELLEKCLILLSVLINDGCEPEFPEGLDVMGIRQHLEKPAKPIMIEVMAVLDSALLLEDGGDATAMLDRMRKTLPKRSQHEQFEQLQFCNFCIVMPVPNQHLRFYEVDFSGNPKNKDFEYYLTRL